MGNCYYHYTEEGDSKCDNMDTDNPLSICRYSSWEQTACKHYKAENKHYKAEKKGRLKIPNPLPNGWNPWKEKEEAAELLKEMKLLRMDFANTFKDIVIIKKHINGIKDVLRMMLKKRPDQATKMRLKEIKDLITDKEGRKK